MFHSLAGFLKKFPAPGKIRRNVCRAAAHYYFPPYMRAARNATPGSNVELL
jgi:hypothetical protein